MSCLINKKIHYRLFKFYVKMGMKVTKIHQTYRFKQWLAKYIDPNTQNGTHAKQTLKKT